MIMPRAYKILVTSDDPALADAIRQALAHQPYEVVSAANGAEVLLQARANRPDLILLDLYLPVLDGMRALEILYSDPAARGIPVVMLGASGDGPECARALGMGAAFCLEKPVALAEAKAVIGRLLLG